LTQPGNPIEIPYTPRPLQGYFHKHARRWSVAVCHRRFGKTVMAVNHLIRKLIQCERPNPIGAYIAPTYGLVERVAWPFVQEYLDVMPDRKFNSALLRAQFPVRSGMATFWLLSGEKPDNLRGIGLDYAILDEYAEMRPRLFPEIVRPALSDRRGGALWIGTPKGMDAFKAKHDEAKAAVGEGDPEWFSCLFRASETGVLDAEELASCRATMSENQYEQEYECSFSAAITGAYYSAQLDKAEADGRVGNVPFDDSMLVSTAWDLGVSDKTSIIAFQADKGGQVRVINCYQNDGMGLGHYVNVLHQWRDDLGYTYDEHLLPHDIDHRVMGKDNEARKRSDILRELGVFPRVVPKRRVTEGIEAVRALLPKCWFDVERCGEELLQALRQYRVKESSGQPLHDENSHYADAMRYLATGYRDGGGDWGAPIEYPEMGVI